MNVAPKETIALSRLAVLVAFFINGTLMATWVSRIPAIQTKMGLSEGALGLTLLGMSAGVLVALFLAGGLIVRFGSPNVTAAGAIVMCLTLPLVALAPNVVMLWVTLFVFGGAISVMDVAMNEQAVLVERNMGRPLMSSFHAAFSIGGLTGALIGAGMASLPIMTLLPHFALVGLAASLVMVFVYRHLLPVKREAQKNNPVFRLPERALWILGIIAFCTAIGEGAMADWSGVYLTQALQTSAAFAALGFAAFSMTMTIGRLFGDKLTASWNSVSIVRFGGLIAALGCSAAILATEPVVVLVGFAAIGLGLANIIPLAFSAAGNHPGIPTGVGIASVATIGYAGFLAGPPVIGLIAEATSLRIAFILVAVLIGSLFFTANAVSPSVDQAAIDSEIESSG
jgi:fucose permease